MKLTALLDGGREERSQARALRADVCASRRRGAALCAHAQSAARAVRRWVRAQKHTHTFVFAMFMVFCAAFSVRFLTRRL